MKSLPLKKHISIQAAQTQSVSCSCFQALFGLLRVLQDMALQQGNYVNVKHNQKHKFLVTSPGCKGHHQMPKLHCVFARMGSFCRLSVKKRPDLVAGIGT